MLYVPAFIKTLEDLSTKKDELQRILVSLSFDFFFKNYLDDNIENNELQNINDGIWLFNAFNDTYGKHSVKTPYAIILINVYGHMIRKHKYSKHYNDIKHNLPLFCKQLIKLLDDQPLNTTPRRGIADMDDFQDQLITLIDRVIMEEKKSSPRN